MLGYEATEIPRPLHVSKISSGKLNKTKQYIYTCDIASEVIKAREVVLKLVQLKCPACSGARSRELSMKLEPPRELLQLWQGENGPTG